MKFPSIILLSLLLMGQALAGELKDLPPKPAAALALPSLTGGMVDLRQLRGQVVLVNFWATWCPPAARKCLP